MSPVSARVSHAIAPQDVRVLNQGAESPSAWHAKPIEAVLSELHTSVSGLADAEATSRLKRFGPNRLPRSTPISALAILRDQLASVVVFLLIGAAGISLALGDHIEAIAIGAVLLINTAIGFVTELRARRAMEALLQLETARAFVIRHGEIRGVDAEMLVPGDVVELDAGFHIPADARLIHTTEFRTTEAALTGESLPVSKSADVMLAADTPLAERLSMIYKGTTVATGTARAVITATGIRTELGRIGVLVGSLREERTPLERRLDTLGRRLVWLALAVAALVATLGALQGASLGLVIETGIALAVAAVPEALPAVATIALAVGMRRMVRRHALVRRLPAVETLGSTTVVCTDKTRTLTSGEMTVIRVWTAGQDFALSDDDPTGHRQDALLSRALEVAVRASRQRASTSADASAWVGDPVDAAVLSAADRIGLDRRRLVHERPAVGLVPFSSERKLMASFYLVDGKLVAFVKGAPGRILALSDRLATAEGELAIDDQMQLELMAVNETLAGRGLRVLALAAGRVTEATESALHGLTFHGFLGLADPPAPGVKQTIARLREAGLRTIMLTGDQRLTAEAIGRELGILRPGDQVVDGRELDAMTREELDARILHVAAFSRVSPEHKLTIVGSLQARGQIVAMLGDGVNDAPALRKADVGVAMGIRGTDVAKEAAAIVLQNDRFETITAAVEEGRIIYANIRKFVFYLFSCNVAEVLVLLAAGLGGLPLPLLPLQLLWLNMVTDTFPALALAMEPGDPDIMRRPPRDPEEAILSRSFLGSIFFYAALITGSTLGAYVWALSAAPTRASTVAFMTLALAQIGHLGNARSAEPVLSPARAAANPYALVGVAVSVVLQLVAVSFDPVANVLRVVPLHPRDWIVIVGLAAIPAVVGQFIKLRRSGG